MAKHKRGGINVRHDTARSQMIVVEIPQKPYAEPMLCPTCRVPHFVKAEHLWLDDRGECTVSVGVLESLKMAGMPGLRVTGRVSNPPVLTVGHKVDRAEVDYRNRSQVIYRLDGYNNN